MQIKEATIDELVREASQYYPVAIYILHATTTSLLQSRIKNAVVVSDEARIEDEDFELRAALSEMRRLLRDGGRYVICDISKPAPRPLRIAVSAYWFIVAPLLGLLGAGVRGLRVLDIYRTYRRWPERGRLLGLLKEFFSVDREVEAMMGGAMTVVLRR